VNNSISAQRDHRLALWIKKMASIVSATAKAVQTVDAVILRAPEAMDGWVLKHLGKEGRPYGYQNWSQQRISFRQMILQRSPTRFAR
jgi:hypothetical protein